MNNVDFGTSESMDGILRSAGLLLKLKIHAEIARLSPIPDSEETYLSEPATASEKATLTYRFELIDWSCEENVVRKKYEKNTSRRH